jgi:phosphate transport system substrate-binding protein
VKTTIFDLIWKLKRTLEAQGHEKIDLHRFTHDKNYRQDILLNIDISELPISNALKEIYTDLLTEDELKLIKEVELPAEAIQQQGTPLSKVEPQIISENTSPPNSRNTPIYAGLTIIALLVLGFNFFQFSNTTRETPINDHITVQINPLNTTVKPPESTATKPVKESNRLPSSTHQTELPTQQTTVKPLIKKRPIPETIKTIPFRIQGSNTIGEVLAPELIKAFYKSEGATNATLIKSEVTVENNLEITHPGGTRVSLIPIHAHGSSTGFKALNNNDTDLAMASRRIKEKEVKLLERRYGNLRSKSTEHIIGMDGLAVIINPSNPINSLSTEQLAQLFSGNISNWQELGGRNEPVKIFARDGNSGTWDSFKAMVLKKHGVKLSLSAKRIESSVELSESVSQTQGSIGFIGLPYVLRAKALAISDDKKGQPIFPTSFTVSTEDYPLVRRLYIYEPTTINTQSDAHRFIRFALSQKGQDVVKKAGFISQNIYKTTPVLTRTLPQQYINTVKNAQRLSLNFRFHSSTFILDNKAERDLERVIQFFETHPGQQAMLIGFSDSIGDTKKNAALSLQRAKTVEQALLSRGINIQRTIGLGEMAPIASNQTKAGRERNRRVEIWVGSDRQPLFDTAIR